MDKAAKLAAARTISITGDADGSAAFDGSGNVSIEVTMSAEAFADYVLKSNVLTLDNTTEFSTNADYEPATKKYVDDNISSTGGSGNFSAGTYTGSGTYGADNPNILYFDFNPKLVLVARNWRTSGLALLVFIRGTDLTCGLGANVGGSAWTGAASFSWQNVSWNDENKSVTWYSPAGADV